MSFAVVCVDLVKAVAAKKRKDGSIFGPYETRKEAEAEAAEQNKLKTFCASAHIVMELVR